MPTGVPPRQIAPITVGLKPLSRISTPSLKESSSSSRAANTRSFIVVLSGRQVRRLYYPTSPVRRHKELESSAEKVYRRQRSPARFVQARIEDPRRRISPGLPGGLWRGGSAVGIAVQEGLEH